MDRLTKKIIIAVILIQLMLLPVLLIATKKQQEVRSRAAEPGNEIQITDQTQGMAEIDASAPSVQAQIETTINTPANSIANVTRNTKIKKEVYGFLWYPYVESDNDRADAHLQYPYMTTLAYAGLVLKKDGTISHTNTPYQVWKSQRLKKILNDAHSSGVKIHPRIALFNSGGNNSVGELLNSTTNRKKAVVSIITEIKNSPNPIDGVNIDFEPVPSSSRDEFTAFIKNLRVEMNKIDPKLEIVVDTFASTAVYEGGFDLKKLSNYVNGFFVMSFTLVSPKSSDVSGSLNPYQALNKVADQYLAKVPGDKIILGFPFYTGIWKTKDSTNRSEKIAGTGSSSIMYYDAYSQGEHYGINYDSKQKTAWYSYPCGKTWKQVYFDNEKAHTDKFQIANDKNLKGVGFWTLSQNKGSLDMWKAIYNDFADKTSLAQPTPKPGFTKTRFSPDPNCPNPSVTPKNSPTPAPSGTPTPVLSDAGLTLDIKLLGIGLTGNENPKKTTAKFNIDVFAPDAAKIGSFSNNLPYDQASGTYKGNVPINIPAANLYNLYISSPSYLTIRVDKELQLDTNLIPAVTLSPGDINEDLSRNILDWNLLNACSIYNRIRNKTLCPDNSNYMTNSDLNSNSIVDADDITLWLQQFRRGISGN